MANINETFLINLSQSLGISYDIKKNALGDVSSPNSAIFNISQIAAILTTGKPLFGVYEDDNSFATIEFINNGNQIEFRFSPGVVFYKSNLVNMSSQSVPVQSDIDYAGTKSFKFYLDYQDFNLAATVFKCDIVSTSLNEVVVDQLPSINYLNNFKTLNINNYLFGIASINSNTKTITLNQDVSAYASAGFTCTLLFEPVVKYITTFSASGTPPDIEIPSTGIILASAEVNITGTVGSLTYACPLGVTKLFEAYPIYDSPSDFFPNTQSYNSFVTTVNNTIKAYKNIQNYSFETNLLNSFIKYTNSVSINKQSFDSYWVAQPYKPTSIFQYGLGFQGLQKADFDPRFKDFYYQSKNVDLVRTLAIFRGDIYGGNAYVGQALGAFPGTNSVLNLVDFTGNSTISNGTYSYGVSAVTPSGEYNPYFNSAANFYFNRNVNNYISYTSTTNISDLLFFHFYKNIKEENGFQQQRITNPFQISQYTLNDNILAKLSTAQGIGSSNFAIQIKVSSASSGIIGGIAFNAYITDPTPLTGIQSCLIIDAGENYINPYALITGTGTGAAISLTTTAGGGIASALVTSFGSGYTEAPTITIFDAQTDSGGANAVITPVLSQLSCGIYTGTSSNPVGSAVTTLQSIPIASISSSYVMNMPVSLGNYIGLNSNTDYWAVFSMNTPYSLTANQRLKFINSSGFSTNFASTNDFVTWTLSTTGVQIAKLGFVDQGLSGPFTSSKGVFLTNDEPVYPCQLQIYVPPLDLSDLVFGDVGENIINISGNTMSSTAPIQNSMIVYVTAQNTQTGVQTTLAASVPRGTTRGSTVVLGTEADIFDKVVDVFVMPDIASGVSFATGTTVINWTIYDTFVVNTIP